MPRIIAQVSFQGTGSIPKDVTTNTWHFESTDMAAGTYTEVIAALTEFYTVTNQHAAVGSYMGSMIQPTGTIKLYKGADPPKRVPVQTGTFTIAPSSTCLPPEVAVCLSFQGAKVSGQIQRRRMGRIYLGPLSTAVSDNGQVALLPWTNIRQAAIRLKNRGNSNPGGLATGTHWVVYSPTGDNWTPVTDGWIDNAFDTQRRRGRDATARNVWS